MGELKFGLGLGSLDVFIEYGLDDRNAIFLPSFHAPIKIYNELSHIELKHRKCNNLHSAILSQPKHGYLHQWPKRRVLCQPIYAQKKRTYRLPISLRSAHQDPVDGKDRHQNTFANYKKFEKRKTHEQEMTRLVDNCWTPHPHLKTITSSVVERGLRSPFSAAVEQLHHQEQDP